MKLPDLPSEIPHTNSLNHVTNSSSNIQVMPPSMQKSGYNGYKSRIEVTPYKKDEQQANYLIGML